MCINFLKVIIETERLIIKPISYEYVDDIFKEFDYEITKYMLPKPANNLEEIRSFIESSIKKMKENIDLHLVLTRKENNRFVGIVGVNNINTIDPELGIWIRKTEHNKGLGLEAMNSIIKWLKDNIKYDHLRYPVDKRNYASRQIPEKNNGIIKKEYTQINMNNEELDEVEYWIYK